MPNRRIRLERLGWGMIPIHLKDGITAGQLASEIKTDPSVASVFWFTQEGVFRNNLEDPNHRFEANSVAITKNASHEYWQPKGEISNARSIHLYRGRINLTALPPLSLIQPNLDAKTLDELGDQYNCNLLSVKELRRDGNWYDADALYPSQKGYLIQVGANCIINY